MAKVKAAKPHRRGGPRKIALMTRVLPGTRLMLLRVAKGQARSMQYLCEQILTIAAAKMYQEHLEQTKQLKG